jgi:hypothetical protein
MAKPITFTGVKLKLLDDQRKNPTISDLDFRVLHAIIAAIDRQTEEAVRKRETLTREAGYKAVRTVEKSVARWVNRGVISVKRGGGRGNANVYRLVEQRANPGTPFN